MQALERRNDARPGVISSAKTTRHRQEGAGKGGERSFGGAREKLKLEAESTADDSTNWKRGSEEKGKENGGGGKARMEKKKGSYARNGIWEWQQHKAVSGVLVL